MTETKDDLKREKVRIVPISNIEDFPDHPFQVKDDESMDQLVESIRMNGVLNPVIALKIDENGESKEQIRRFIRLNELTPELLEFVDEGKIGMRPAVELSYLQEEEMRDLVDFIDNEEVFPSHAQTIRMKALSKEGKLDTDAIREIMLEEKPNQKARIKIPMEKIEKYFTSGTSQQQIEDTIVKALALYRQRQKENRDAR